jgi:hypothetical protein
MLTKILEALIKMRLISEKESQRQKLWYNSRMNLRCLSFISFCAVQASSIWLPSSLHYGKTRLERASLDLKRIILFCRSTQSLDNCLKNYLSVTTKKHQKKNLKKDQRSQQTLCLN